MKTYTMAELSHKAKAICESDEPAMITTNGKPQSLIFNIRDMRVDDAINAMTDAYGMLCLTDMNLTAAERGLDSMTLDEINEEIRRTRLERRQRKASGKDA